MTASAKILGFSFDLPQPYNVGHSCTASEAEVLNRTLVRGLSKGLYKVLSASLGDGPPTEDQRGAIRQRAEEYIADYCSGFALGHDVQRATRIEAERIARQMLETALYKQGKKLADLASGEREEEIARLAGSEKVRLEAERRIRVTQEIAERAHEELLEALGGDDGGSGC